MSCDDADDDDEEEEDAASNAMPLMPLLLMLPINNILPQRSPGGAHGHVNPRLLVLHAEGSHHACDHSSGRLVMVVASVHHPCF